MILRARIVVPRAGSVIENGAVRLKGDKITEVGRFGDIPPLTGEAVVDMAEQVLIPGLVNAHCHLDYTRMAGMIPPRKSFTEWIGAMNALKASWTLQDFQTSWLEGAHSLIASGTSTVADIECQPELPLLVLEQTPLRVHPFFEIIGIKRDHAPDSTMADTLNQFREAIEQYPHIIGLSPHAPYSTTPGLMRLATQIARDHHWPIMIHVAESSEEYEMFMQAEGPLYGWLKSQRDMSDCLDVTPVQHLASLGVLGKDVMAVHVNYLGRGDEELLARHEVSVVHCPRSHGYFQHRAFPFEQLSEADINICLGTDSMATVKAVSQEPLELNMFAEMREFAATHTLVSADRIFQMATLNGARALGLEGLVGELAPGAWADLSALPGQCGMDEIFEFIVNYQAKPSAVMIGGQWALPPSCNGRNPETTHNP